MSTSQEVRENLAQVLGEEAAALRVENPRWVELMKEGVIVGLSIGRWRAKTRLSWSDLGIELDGEEDKELASIIDLGHKKLLPGDMLRELDAIESTARKQLEKFAYKTHWGWFVPVTAYGQWKEKNQEQRARYFAKRDELVRDYDELVASVLAGYRLAARGAYRRLLALHPEAVSRYSEAEFVSLFVATIKEHLPSAVTIRESFYFDVSLSYVPLPSMLAADAAEAERIDRERREEAGKDWLVREMNRDVLAQARAEKERLIDGFLRDVVVQLRSMVYEASVDVLAAIQKNDRLPPRSVVQLNNLITQVKNLNFYGDVEIEEMVNRVNRALVVGAEDRSVGQIADNLRDIATVMRASLIGLGERPRAARNLGLADNPAGEELVRARRRLDLAEDGEALPLAELSPAGRQARLL
jgi:hypothetical protein